MTADHTTRRKASLRKLLYIPLAVGVLAGAVGAGTGLGTAAAIPDPDAVTTSTPTPDTAPGSAGDSHWWTLKNDTGQPIYGTWSEQTGSDVSALEVVKDMPLPSGGHESRPRNDSSYGQYGHKSYWMGHICYNNAWWNFPRTETYLVDETFSLWSDGGGLHASWATWYLDEVSLVLNPHEAPC
ncbi:hypothetical protein [Rhodococcus jostii]|uniref:hypothetical protein n=2 Tax=Rhodococcus jostii TaxID=132919 RepID=UPI003641D775